MLGTLTSESAVATHRCYNRILCTHVRTAVSETLRSTPVLRAEASRSPLSKSLDSVDPNTPTGHHLSQLVAMRTQSIFAAVLVMLLACHEPALAQFGGGGGSPPKVPAVLSDIPYIKCGTCQAFVKQAMAMVKKLRSEEKPGKKVRGWLGCVGGSLRAGTQILPEPGDPAPI